MNNSQQIEMIDHLMKDTIGDMSVSAHPIQTTIKNILREYNLDTDRSFIEKIVSMKFDRQGDAFTLDDMPKQLTDAAFLPVNTIADIALRQDLDLVISQIPEMFACVQLTRDAVCEADIIDGCIARTIEFDHEKIIGVNDDEASIENIMAEIEAMEEKLELQSIIKNHLVFNTLLYGEGYLYAVPYAKVFQDLNIFKSNDKMQKGVINSMFSNTQTMHSYGFGEQAEIKLKDTLTIKDSKGAEVVQELFTESEIINILPGYHASSQSHPPQNGIVTQTNRKAYDHNKQFDNKVDHILEQFAERISFVKGFNEHDNTPDIAIPVIEEDAEALQLAYNAKYKQEDGSPMTKERAFFESHMVAESGDKKDFDSIKGLYIKILPATKLIPIRVDRHVIGYYYISDMTRPEEMGQRRNSGLTGYTLQSPSVGFDTFQPDRMFCEKLASKIINNFNLKFVQNNSAAHEQIVAILQAHKFNESLMRFVWIPAEHVVQCTINKDGAGKGHSMLEPGLVTARMYMFLKMYSLLYQINNAQIRVYNLRLSGIDTNYKQFVNETMRKFQARRITANDIFNYRSSMTKISGGSELIMPLGKNDTPPISIDHIPAAEAPLNKELLDDFKIESINASSVPSMMVMNNMSEVEFAQEYKEANARFFTMTGGYKLEFNRDLTKLYRVAARAETDIPESVIQDMKFKFRMATAKQMAITTDMIGNFNGIREIAIQNFLTEAECKPAEGEEETPLIKAYSRKLIHLYMPQMDIEKMLELADEARTEVNIVKMQRTSPMENLLDDKIEPEEGGGEEGMEDFGGEELV